MANLPLAFAELLAGGIMLTAGISDPNGSISNVIEGLDTGKLASFNTGSSSSSATGGSVAAAGGASPLPGVTSWGRTDQGVDASAKPGSPVAAVVSGTVTSIIPNFYSGQPAVFVSSTGLPSGATGIYYAEQLTPSVKVGDTVQAGQPIGSVAATGTGLEIGFASGAQTLARATTGYTEGEITHAGQAFRSFLQSLGVAGL
jgi:murein DD-endopeptidase MepM/ murein hydrolase activator NlpD